jgi:hypothetical protein
MQLLKKTIIIVRDPYTHIAIGRETSAGKLKFRICQFAKFTDMMVTSRKPITIQAFFYLDCAIYNIKERCIYSECVEVRQLWTWCE